MDKASLFCSKQFSKASSCAKSSWNKIHQDYFTPKLSKQVSPKSMPNKSMTQMATQRLVFSLFFWDRVTFQMKRGSNFTFSSSCCFQFIILYHWYTSLILVIYNYGSLLWFRSVHYCFAGLALYLHLHLRKIELSEWFLMTC